MFDKLHSYISRFNKLDDQLYPQLISNQDAESFLAEQIPLLDVPDKQLEEIYYFRWWTFRKHIKDTDKGHIITEFLPSVPWSGPYNSINCPACFHIREGRWLKDTQGWLKEYIQFWLDGAGDAYRYSTWLVHAVLEYCTIKNDFDFAVENLDKLILFFETREKTNKNASGIYWSQDNLDGMEFSVSGSGLRPTISSYACADALAISKIADRAKREDVKERFAKKADEIKKGIDNLLWDENFYKTIPLKNNQELFFDRRPAVNAEKDAKELIGFVPWYFNIPDDGKETAFAELLNKEGFASPFGLTTVEQRNARFMEEHNHECLWNGPVWPFATSQVLVAVANLLHNYNQSVITKSDYYQMLLQYANSQHLTKEDGSLIPWIDENLHPFSGIWLARDILKKGGWAPERGGYERGKDYNHSLFCDLILSGLLGIDVQHDSFIVSPLIPDSWDYFTVENLWLNSNRYRIVYDKDGSHYARKPGISIEKY